MAFDQKMVLFKELTGGYQLTERLQALLSRPLDGTSQEEARAVAGELARVFMVSLFTLKPDDRAPPEMKNVAVKRRRENFSTESNASNSVRHRDQNKCLRKEGATRTELLTPTPYTDGYQWRKYGQKKIHNSNFQRNYYRCAYSRDRQCPATKQVQQQDRSDPPAYQVTYVNEHACHVASNNAVPAANQAPPILDSTEEDSPVARFDATRENEAIISCLASVFNGQAETSLSCSQRDASESVLSAGPSPTGTTFLTPFLPSLNENEMDEIIRSNLLYEAQLNPDASTAQFLPRSDGLRMKDKVTEPSWLEPSDMEIL